MVGIRRGGFRPLPCSAHTDTDASLPGPDGSPLVARALAIGQPVIVVTLNYRLGVLGFIYSQKLLADAATQTDVPEHGRSTANLALLDIGMAMQWVGAGASPLARRCPSLTR